MGDREELKRAVLERVQYVPVQVQQWVPGRGLGVDLLARHGEIVMRLAHERLHEVPLTGGGSSYRRTIPMPPELYADAQKLIRALGYHGVAMVEFRGDPVTGRHWLMEINARFWGSLPLAIFAGADFPRALAAMLLRDELPNGPPPRDNVYARTIHGDVSWIRLILKRRAHFSQYELTEPLGKSLLAWGRVFTGREAWDGANLKDPKPFLREVQHVADKVLRAVYDKARLLVVQIAARRSSLERARRFRGARPFSSSATATSAGASTPRGVCAQRSGSPARSGPPASTRRARGPRPRTSSAQPCAAASTSPTIARCASRSTILRGPISSSSWTSETTIS